MSGTTPEQNEPLKEIPQDSTTSEASTDEVVGYGRPPKHTRFRPGRSGNPRGRPKGVKSTGMVVQEVLGRKITITEAGRRRQAPVVEAALIRLTEAALKGDPKALKTMIDLIERYSPVTPHEGVTPSDAEDAAVIAAYLARCQPSQ